MHLEHCASYGHDISFTTPNYHIATTPRKEWGIVVLGEQPAQDEMRHGRTILDLALARHWADSDELVLRETDDPTGAATAAAGSPEKRMHDARQLVSDAGLQRSEVASVILYTGPMVRAACLVDSFSHLFRLLTRCSSWAPSRSTTSSTACFADSQTIGSESTATAATSSPPPLPSLPVPFRRFPASPSSRRAPPSIAASAAVWSSPTPSSATTPWAAEASPSGASSAPRATRRSRSPTPTQETARPTPQRPSRWS